MQLVRIIYRLLVDVNFSALLPLWYFFLTLVGATMTQVMSLKMGTVGTRPFLEMWWPKKSDVWYSRMNCLLLIILGTILSFVILEPDSAKSSLFAGLTWCGTLQSLGLLSKKQD